MNRLILAVALFALSPVCRGDSLSAALARMNQGAEAFHGMAANITMVTHTAILDDNTSENGTIKMEKTKSGTQALIDFTSETNRRTIAFLDKTIQLYFPKLNLVQVYKLGRKANLLDQYLLLGFGTSGKDLTKGYDVQMEGTEQISGQNASKLVLVPKAAGVKEQLSKVEIWLPATSGYPIQQKFYNPSGNFRLATYTNFQLNPSMGPIKLNAPSNAKVEYPQ
jgi:outer membrane lipoprotein-sorting protein